MKDTENQSLALTIQDEGHATSRIIKRVVLIGCSVNALLMTAKLCAGYLGHSEALVADGYHSFNDMLSDIIMFVFVGISYRSPDNSYTYGYGKFGTFASFLMSILLLVISAILFYHGIESIVDFAHGHLLPQPDIWTFVVIIFAMVCKEGLYRFYSAMGKKTDSKALLANAWHHRSDALASIATLIGITCAHFFGPSFRVLDPVAALVIAIFILIPALRLLWSSFKELMDRALPSEYIEKAKKVIEETEGVEGIKFLRSRRNGHHLLFDIGIYVKPDVSVSAASTIASSLKESLCSSFCPHLITTVTAYPEHSSNS